MINIVNFGKFTNVGTNSNDVTNVNYSNILSQWKPSLMVWAIES